MRLSFAAALLISASPAIAADDEATEEGEVIIVTGERTGYAVETVRSATRTDVDLIDVPQALSVVTEQQIEDQAMLSIADVLRYVPGAVIAQGEGHRDQIVLRGNTSTSDFFVDGLRDDVQYYRGLYNLERVEVLKGPNAMIFGRGGGGGVINRVTKRPLANDFARASGGLDSEGAWVADADLNYGFSPNAAARLNAVYERFESFRDVFEGRRIGINPTVAATFGNATRIDLSYEFNRDDRVVDRGVPSARPGSLAEPARPLDGFDETFFGARGINKADFEAHVVRATLEHRFSDALRLTSRLLYGDYDKLYRNLFPATPVTVEGGVPGFGVEAYEDGTKRRNLISQTDLLLTTRTGGVDHSILAGFEFTDQDTDSFRFNGLFANPAGGANVTRRRATLADPFAPPPIVEWRLARDNETDVKVWALYAQDVISFGPQFDLIAGLRYDRFDIDAHNLMSGQRLGRTDDLWSPRLGLVFKPRPQMSLYASYGRSFLPQSGDQFTSLALSDAALEPERFDNYELGFKWAIRPTLNFTAAVYQLDRTNTRVADPARPGSFLLSGEQRSRGLELELVGEIMPNWRVSAGYALQEAEITEKTSACDPDARDCDLPLFPKHQLSLWTRYDITPRLGAGAGLYHQSKSFASISNTVVLPAYTRIDAAAYYRLIDGVEAQLNVENLFGEDYYLSAHNDNNVMPGAPRTVRATLRFGF